MMWGEDPRKTRRAWKGIREPKKGVSVRSGEPRKEPGSQKGAQGKQERLRRNPIGDQRSLGRLVASRKGQESSGKARGPKGKLEDPRRG